MTDADYRPTEIAYPSQETDDRSDILFAASLPHGASGWATHRMEHSNLFPGHVDVILWRTKAGMVCAYILRYHLTTQPFPDGTLYLWVHPAFRHIGLGMQLLERAYNLWNIRLEGQRFTAEGAALTNQFVSRKTLQLNKERQR